MGYPDQQLFHAVQPHLGPGEQVRTVAYGERGMPFWANLVCFLAVLVTTIPGLVLYLIWHFLALKHYVVALTDRRLLVMEVSGLTPKTMWSYPLPLPGRFSMAPGGYGWHRGQILQISGPPQPLWVKFTGSSPTNLHNAATLFQGLQQAAQMQGGGWPQAHPQLPPGGGYGPPPGGGYGPPPGGGYGPPPGGGYGR